MRSLLPTHTLGCLATRGSDLEVWNLRHNPLCSDEPRCGPPKWGGGKALQLIIIRGDNHNPRPAIIVFTEVQLLQKLTPLAVPRPSPFPPSAD